ncbi:MAG: N-acetylmuramoyl-L-alanine amidase [Gemmatimonadota bacterium]
MKRVPVRPARFAGVFVAASLTIGFSSGTAEAPVIPGGPERPERAAPRVALQAGHWLASEAPDELRRLRSNGANWNGLHESEVTLRIAELAAERLRAAGVEVEVLPTTVPPSYQADLFISIHADGNNSSDANGFSVAASRRDRTGRGSAFVEILAQTYREATGLRHHTNVTRRMVSYYAFNSRRYDHAIHDTTPGVIIETGFLTSPKDRAIIVDAPERSAEGIAAAVLRYLEIPPAPPATIVAR